MNLAVKDIAHNKGRFLLTAAGIGMLLMTVMGMTGIYRGLIADATNFVDRVGADLWVVQGDTRGPFAELSSISPNLKYRLQKVQGVEKACLFVSHTIQRTHEEKKLRIVVQGLDWPEDAGHWLPIVRGRSLQSAHYEMVADELLGLDIGERIRLGKDSYSVVGITRGMVGQGGDGMAFFTVRDAQTIQHDQPAEALRLDRAQRGERVGQSEAGRTDPSLARKADQPASAIPAIEEPPVSAVMVHLKPGSNTRAVIETIEGWGDVTAYTSEEQRGLLVEGSVDRARRQIGLFRVVLVVISAIIMALIIYTLTLDKVHEIALLKLMGARNRVILGMILQQALLLGGIGYVLAYYLGQWTFPRFPRRVIVETQDLYSLGAVVLLISLASSLLGIWKAMKVEPNEVVG